MDWAYFKQRTDWCEARAVVYVIQIHLPRCTDGCGLGAHKGIAVILLISSLSTMFTQLVQGTQVLQLRCQLIRLFAFFKGSLKKLTVEDMDYYVVKDERIPIILDR